MKKPNKTFGKVVLDLEIDGMKRELKELAALVVRIKRTIKEIKKKKTL